MNEAMIEKITISWATMRRCELFVDKYLFYLNKINNLTDYNDISDCLLYTESFILSAICSFISCTGSSNNVYKIEEFLQSDEDKEFLLQAKNYRNKSYAHIDRGGLHVVTNHINGNVMDTGYYIKRPDIEFVIKLKNNARSIGDQLCIMKTVRPITIT